MVCINTNSKIMLIRFEMVYVAQRQEIGHKLKVNIGNN